MMEKHTYSFNFQIWSFFSPFLLLFCPLQASWGVSSGRVFYWPAWPPTCCSPASTCTTGGGEWCALRQTVHGASCAEPEFPQRRGKARSPWCFLVVSLCGGEKPWTSISLIPECVLLVLSHKHTRVFKDLNRLSTAFQIRTVKCAIKHLLFCLSCFALHPCSFTTPHTDTVKYQTCSSDFVAWLFWRWRSAS